MKRRLFLQGSLAAGALGALATTGLLIPGNAMAAWPKEAFQAKELSEALKQLLGSDATTEDKKKVWIEADDAAEDGAQVRIEVYAEMPDIESISILAPKNPIPLIANFKLEPGTQGFIATKIKMAESGEVVAVAKAGDSLISARKHIKVTAGGCK
jgi:sulfur-oxidizing protein SoxY